MTLARVKNELHHAQVAVAHEWGVPVWQVPFLFLRHANTECSSGHCYGETAAVQRYLSVVSVLLEDHLDHIKLP